MALTVDVIKTKMKKEGKLTAEEIYWILDHIDSLEKHMEKMGAQLDERLRKMEREKDDHMPGGIQFPRKQEKGPPSKRQAL